MLDTLAAAECSWNPLAPAAASASRECPLRLVFTPSPPRMTARKKTDRGVSSHQQSDSSIVAATML